MLADPRWTGVPVGVTRIELVTSSLTGVWSLAYPAARSARAGGADDDDGGSSVFRVHVS